MSKLTTLVFVTLLTACAEAPQPQTDLDGLKAMRDVVQARLDTRDPAAIATLYAESGSILPPNGDAVKGHAAIEAFWVEFLSSGISIKVTDTNVNAGGDVGYKAGTYTIASAYGELIDEGKYVEVWHYMDGRWQMMYDMFSSNRPLAAPARADEAQVMDE